MRPEYILDSYRIFSLVYIRLHKWIVILTLSFLHVCPGSAKI